jgi:hypothetical protein
MRSITPTFPPSPACKKCGETMRHFTTIPTVIGQAGTATSIFRCDRCDAIEWLEH